MALVVTDDVVGPAIVSLSQVKAALNMTGAADDAELLRLINAAEAEYAEFVGPLPGVRTVRAAGSPTILPRHTVQVTAATYLDGTVASMTGFDFDADAAILYGAFAGPLLLTVLVGPPPANHREAIIADVAGLFTATQRGGGASAPRFPGEGYSEPLDNPEGRPVTLFPRIRALASRRVA